VVLNNWQLLRQYNVLVNDGVADPINHRCGYEMVSVLGEDDEPEFLCARCNNRFVPGIAFWNILQRTVDDNDFGP
jgi:hypothetical protein